jgi:hypothetical protein
LFRLRSRRFAFWQKVVALAPLLLVAVYLPGELMVRCHVDGLLRPAPCCSHEVDAGDSGPALKVRDCCDREVTATHRPVSEAVRAPDNEPIAAAALAAVPAGRAASSWPPARAAWAAQRHGPAREGPPIIVIKHAFLI